MNRIRLENVAWPEISRPVLRPDIPDACFTRRVKKLREAMEKQGLDCVAVYGDREHYANFKYLIGFEPRFEEGLIVIHRDETVGNAVLLGNECVNMANYARIPVKTILCQYLSLPGQPMNRFDSMERCLRDAGIREGLRVGLAGWKLITGKHEADPLHSFCAPSFLVDALRGIIGHEQLVNATGIFIDPNEGIRLIHDADEIAYMEYGAALASDGVISLWKQMAPGMREMELAANLQNYGQQLSCHNMFSSGENTKKGLVSPGFRALELGDPVSFSMGLEGGLTCRGGYAAHCKDELESEARCFETEIAGPYYEGVVAWYETIGLGVTGGELYDVIQGIIPHEKFGWVLNPGHMISYEEWLTSSIAPGNTGPFRSGMLVQMDIIPSVAPCVSPNAEDGICIADDALQAELRERYPEVWDRFMQRRAYMEKELGIRLKKEILPMSNLAGRYSPYLLDLEKAFTAR